MRTTKNCLLPPVLAILTASTAAAQVPDVIGYQGLLTDVAGEPVSLSVPMTIRLYATAEGGPALWEETHPSVAVVDGIFSVSIGSITPLDASWFPPGEDRWLAWVIDDDDEMVPRHRLISVPYALRAASADTAGNADLLGGYAAADLEESNEISQALTSHQSSTDAHHQRYSDTEALAAVNASPTHGSDAQHNYTTSLPWSAVSARPPVISSVSGVTHDQGNIDLIAGPNISIAPDGASHSITIGASLVDTQCDDGSCERVQLDSGSNPDNVLDTTPAGGSADALYWGNEVVALGPHVPVSHASSHARNGADALDGDRLGVDFTPANYAPDSSAPEANHVDDLAAHLQGIDNRLVFGSHYDYVADDTVSTTMGTTYVTKIALVTGDLPAGDYRLSWSYAWNHDSTDNDFQARLLDGAAEIMAHREEPKDSYGTFGGTGSNQQMRASGFNILSLAGSHTFSLQFRSDTFGYSSSMWQSRIEIYRVR